MLFYLFANCFSSLSGVVNKFFIRHGYYDLGVQMLDVTFHANIYNVILYFMLYYNFQKNNMINFSIRNTFYSKRELLQILLFAIPIYASAYKLLMFEKMPISYVEISAMIKPLIVFFLAIVLLKEKFYNIYLLYLFIAIIGFCVINYEDIFLRHGNGVNSDILKILYYIIIASIGDITRRYYCRKWDNAMQSICVEVIIFAVYGCLYLSIVGRFSINILINPCTLIYALITFFHHICVILGVQRAKSVAALEIISFSKLAFSLLFCYLILGENQKKIKIIGGIIIFIAIALFNIHRRYLKNKENKTLNL